MVRSKQKRMKMLLMVLEFVGVSVVGCCWSCFEEGMEIDEKKSKVQMVIGFLYKMVLQKTLHPISPILWAWLLFFYVCCCCCCCLFVCLSVYLFDCLSVFMSGWVVGWLVCLLKLFIFLFVWLFCMFVWMFDCLFALQWGRFHHPFCNFCKSQITVQNLDFVGGLLDGGIGV